MASSGLFRARPPEAAGVLFLWSVFVSRGRQCAHELPISIIVFTSLSSAE